MNVVEAFTALLPFWDRVVKENELVDGFMAAPETVADLMTASTSTTDSDGTVRWFLHDALHKVDGPAVCHPDDSVEWWRHGERATVDHERSLNAAYAATCMDDLRVLRMSDVDEWVALVLLWNEALQKPGELASPSRRLLTEIAAGAA